MLRHKGGDTPEVLTPGPVCSSSCSSVTLWNGIVAAGYGNGQIRLWEAGSGQIRAQVSAHARWIYALDLAPLTGKVQRGQGFPVPGVTPGVTPGITLSLPCVARGHERTTLTCQIGK